MNKIWLILVLGLVLAGCIPTEQVLEEITLNVCQYDPENADLWRRGGINLFDKPDWTKRVGGLPACSSITLEVLEKGVYHNGVEFYKVRYGKIVGWTTKRLLTGEE